MGKHDLFAKGLQAGVDSGKGGVGFLAASSEAMFGPDDPDTKFYRWLAENQHGLRSAAEELGIEVDEGKGFIFRLRDAYISTLSP